MIDEHKLLLEADRAAKAQALLENDLLNEAYAQIEKQLVEAWASTPALDSPAREKIWDSVQANRKHRDYLISVFNDGKVASHQLQGLATIAERKKRFGIL